MTDMIAGGNLRKGDLVVMCEDGLVRRMPHAIDDAIRAQLAAAMFGPRRLAGRVEPIANAEDPNAPAE